MKRTGTIFIGIVLLAVGIGLLLNEYGVGLKINFSWPVFLIFTGGILLAAYFIARPNPGFLVVGSTLITLGIFFTLMHDVPTLGLHYKHYWPGILIAIGIGLFVSGLIHRSSRNLITAGIVFAGIGGVFLMFSIAGWRRFGPRSIGLLLGFVLVLVGLKVVIDVFLKKKAEA